MSRTYCSGRKWAGGLRERFGGRKVALCLELAQGPIVSALLEHDVFVLFPINPMTLAKYRQAFAPSRAKDDPTDARLAVEFLRRYPDKLSPFEPESEGMRALRRLVELRRELVEDRVRLTNRMTSSLKQYFPQVLSWFEDKGRRILQLAPLYNPHNLVGIEAARKGLGCDPSRCGVRYGVPRAAGSPVAHVGHRPGARREHLRGRPGHAPGPPAAARSLNRVVKADSCSGTELAGIDHRQGRCNGYAGLPMWSLRSAAARVMPALAAAVLAAPLGCTSDNAKRAPGVSEGGARDAGQDRSEPQMEAGGRPEDAAWPVDDATLADAALDGSTSSADLPDLLSETGLYRDIGSETLGEGVRAFAPRFDLWSDGATKRRWFYLPPGAVIDATDPDAWIFPVGTKAWKEFTRGVVRVETRLIEKTEAGWQAVAYVWNADETDAIRTPTGLENARGTEHDVPREGDCFACHAGSPDMLLGVSAVQLGTLAGIDGGASSDVTLGILASEGALEPAPANTELTLPGSDLDQGALGRLHVDCGHCHRPGTLAWERAEMDLHLATTDLASLADTAVFRTAVGVPSERTIDGTSGRIVPGLPEQSAVYVRMTSRDSVLGMPTVGTELVDDSGSAVIRSWIRSLSPDGGTLDAGTDAADGAP